MLDKFKDILKKEDEIKFKLPRHIAIVTKGKHIYADKHKVTIDEIYGRSNVLILSTISSAIKLGIP